MGRILRGRIHQGYPYFSGEFTGRQCTAIAFLALCLATIKLGSLWTTDDIDNIIYRGNDEYVNTIRNRLCLAHPRNLQHNELPQSISNFLNSNIDYIIAPHQNFYGVVGRQSNPYAGSHNLQTALLMGFSGSNYLLATFADYTTALFYDEVSNSYYLFDSNACNESGQTDANGYAILLEFSTVLQILQHLQERHLNQVFEVTAFSFTQTVIADSSQLSDLTDCLQDVPCPLPSNGDSNTPTSMNTSNLNIEDHFCNNSNFQQTSDTFYNLNHTYSTSTQKMHDSNTQSCVNASNFNSTFEDHSCNHYDFQRYSNKHCNLNHTYSSQMPAAKKKKNIFQRLL